MKRVMISQSRVVLRFRNVSLKERHRDIVVAVEPHLEDPPPFLFFFLN